MRVRWFIPIAFLLPLRLWATDPVPGARVTTIPINPREITVLHLRPEFESTIHMPEEVTSVILGSPGKFKAEHSQGEPEFVYIKPITNEAAQSNLLIATKSGQHVTLELVSDGTETTNQRQPTDFLIEYRAARSFLISDGSDPVALLNTPAKETEHGVSRVGAGTESPPLSSLDEAFKREESINAPRWKKWEDQQIETSIGEMWQLGNRTIISYSILNSSNQSIEIVPPQIQIAARKATKKKRKEGKGIISNQLEIRDYRLGVTRLEPGERADGAVIFDRPNFKESTEKLYLQIAQADQVDRPILIHLPFTPLEAVDTKQKGEPRP